MIMNVTCEDLPDYGLNGLLNKEVVDNTNLVIIG